MKLFDFLRRRTYSDNKIKENSVAFKEAQNINDQHTPDNKLLGNMQVSSQSSNHLPPKEDSKSITKTGNSVKRIKSNTKIRKDPNGDPLYEYVLSSFERENLEKATEALFSYANNLKNYEDLDLSAPTDGEEVIFIPIEGTFNERFFIRMFLLRNHKIENEIISKFDMIQYQIPVSARNEELILLTYGTHLFEKLRLSDDKLSAQIGDSFCDDINNQILMYCPMLGLYFSIENYLHNNDRYNAWSSVTSRSQVSIKFNSVRELINSWINRNWKKAKAEYLKSLYRQSPWANEQKLHSLIRCWYPQAKYQYRSSWLAGQTLDIYIPEIRTGIEYQGKQHYEAIDYYGGESHLRLNQEKDKHKAKKCADANVELKYWKYDKKVSLATVRDFLNIQSNDSVIATINNDLPESVGMMFFPNVIEAQIKQKKEVIIRQYTLKGAFVNQFESIPFAGKATKISASGISNCVNHHSSSSEGFIWTKEKNDDPPLSKNEVLKISKTVIRRPKQHVFRDSTGAPKAVFQIDLHTGEILNEFSSFREASRETGINSNCISNVAYGTQKTAGGYKWALKDLQEQGNEKFNDGKPLAVRQLDKDKHIIAEYPSINAAASATNIDRNAIKRIARGQGKTAGGYYWEFATVSNNRNTPESDMLKRM